MKTSLILVVVFGLLAALALAVYAAGPYLVCDPQEGVTKYRARVSSDGGQTWGAWVESDAVNNAMRYDLGTMTPGAYKGQAEAGGYYIVTDDTTGQQSTVWKWSDPAPFGLNVVGGAKPAKIRAE